MRLLTLAGILAAVTFPAIAQTHARGGTAETLRNGPTPVENAVVPFLNHQEARTASDRLLFDRRQQHTRYAVPKASAGNMPEIYGSVIYSDNAATKPPVYISSRLRPASRSSLWRRVPMRNMAAPWSATHIIRHIRADIHLCPYPQLLYGMHPHGLRQALPALTIHAWPLMWHMMPPPVKFMAPSQIPPVRQCSSAQSTTPWGS